MTRFCLRESRAARFARRGARFGDLRIGSGTRAGSRSTSEAIAQGFTLVELLVGMTILALVTTGIFTSFNVGLALRERCRERLDGLQIARHLASLLADDLRNLAPGRPSLAIENEGLSMLRQARGLRDSCAVLLVQYRWAEQEDGSIGLGREATPLSSAEILADRMTLLGYELGEKGLAPVWTSSARDTARTERREIPGVLVFEPTGVLYEEGGLVAKVSGPADSLHAVEFAIGLERTSDRPPSKAAAAGGTFSPAGTGGWIRDWSGELPAYDFEFSVWLAPIDFERPAGSP
jgi:prepilin-type N-terminal cleavage/methylation domain-containing protein